MIFQLTIYSVIIIGAVLIVVAERRRTKYWKEKGETFVPKMKNPPPPPPIKGFKTTGDVIEFLEKQVIHSSLVELSNDYVAARFKGTWTTASLQPQTIIDLLEHTRNFYIKTNDSDILLVVYRPERLIKEDT